MKQTILYIIPGFGESPKSSGYKTIIKEAFDAGYEPVPVPIKWERSVFSDWLKTFEEVYSQYPGRKSSVLGFSFGAMIAAVSAKKHTFESIFFCSISPYFKDNLEKIPKTSLSWLGKRRVDDFKKYSFPRDVNTKALFIMGNEDWPYGLEVIKKRESQWRGSSSLILIDGVAHDISDPKYLKVVKEVLNKKRSLRTSG